MFSGRPPTLWWVLIRSRSCPPLSIQSGAIVPWTRWSAPRLCASRSKSSMNVRPMTVRFFSGSTMPLRAEKNSSAAWTIRCRTLSSLRVWATRSSRRARFSTARMAAFSPRSRPTAATGTPGGICETLRTASKFNLPLTGTPITGFVVCAAMVPGSAAERPAIAMITLAVVFRIKSRRRSGVRWAEATTISYPTPNWSKNELACFPTSASLLEPSTMRTSTGIGWDKVGSWNKGFPLRRWNAASDLALHDGQEEEADCRGGSDDRREDHANRFDDDVDQVHGRAERTGVPRPQDTDDQTTYKQSDPDLPALPASKVRRESAGDDQEETEGQEEDGQERQPVKRGKAAHVIPQNLMPVKVFVSMTPGMDRILSTTT